MYEELVERLRHRGTLYNGISLFDDAANVIEKLIFKYNFVNMTKKEADIALKNEFLRSSKLEAENKQLRRERDQAVEDLNTLRKRSGFKCEACYYSDHYSRDVCIGCEYNNDNNWKWRGVQEEENE